VLLVLCCNPFCSSLFWIGLLWLLLLSGVFWQLCCGLLWGVLLLSLDVGVLGGSFLPCVGLSLGFGQISRDVGGCVDVG
jgi:hypothetical protein